MTAFNLDSWFGSPLPWTCLKFGFLMEFPEIEVEDKSRILFDVAREDSFERMESERTEGVRENYLESACMSYTGPFLPLLGPTAWKTCASILFSPCCYAVCMFSTQAFSCTTTTLRPVFMPFVQTGHTIHANTGARCICQHS